MNWNPTGWKMTCHQSTFAASVEMSWEGAEENYCCSSNTRRRNRSSLRKTLFCSAEENRESYSRGEWELSLLNVGELTEKKMTRVKVPISHSSGRRTFQRSPQEKKTIALIKNMESCGEYEFWSRGVEGRVTGGFRAKRLRGIQGILPFRLGIKRLWYRSVILFKQSPSSSRNSDFFILFGTRWVSVHGVCGETN